jgi:hypothetical protein
MKTIRITLVAAALSLTTIAVCMASATQMGTWKLNESKSKFSSKARNHTVTYTAAPHDMVKVDVMGEDKDGKPVHWDWVGKFDGKPYKMHGNPNADMATYRMVNDHTNEITMTRGGKTTVMTTVTVAPDGKSRTVMSTMTGADGKKSTDKAVYDKQ